MRVLMLAAPLVAAAACDLSLHLDELETTSLEMALGGETPRSPQITLGWQAGRCAELSEGVTLSLEVEGITPVTATDFSVGRRGGWASGGFAGLPLCENSILMEAEVTTELSRADAVGLVLRDAVREAPLTATLASPFVERRADFAPPPPWEPGTTVELRWSPATDVIDTLQVFYFTREGFQATGSSRGGAQTFTVPADLVGVRRAELAVEWQPAITCDPPLTCTVRGVSQFVVDAPLSP